MKSTNEYFNYFVTQQRVCCERSDLGQELFYTVASNSSHTSFLRLTITLGPSYPAVQWGSDLGWRPAAVASSNSSAACIVQSNSSGKPPNSRVRNLIAGLCGSDLGWRPA